MLSITIVVTIILIVVLNLTYTRMVKKLQEFKYTNPKPLIGYLFRTHIYMVIHMVLLENIILFRPKNNELNLCDVVMFIIILLYLFEMVVYIYQDSKQ